MYLLINFRQEPNSGLFPFYTRCSHNNSNVRDGCDERDNIHDIVRDACDDVRNDVGYDVRDDVYTDRK